MSLLIDTAIAAESIVRAAWARAAANRKRLRRRLDVQSVREQAVTDRTINAINGRLLRGAAGWEQAYTTPTPLKYKPDEPVGYPIVRQQAPTIQATGFWLATQSEYDGVPFGNERYSARFYLAPGNGQDPILVPFEITNEYVFKSTIYVESGTGLLLQQIEASYLVFDYFPTSNPQQALWVGAAIRAIVTTDITTTNSPVAFSTSFTVIGSAAYLVTVDLIASASPPPGVITGLQSSLLGVPFLNSFDKLNTRSSITSLPIAGLGSSSSNELRSPDAFALYDAITAGAFASSNTESDSLFALASIIDSYPSGIPNHYASEPITQQLTAAPGILPPSGTLPFALYMATNLGKGSFCLARTGY